MGWMEGRKGGRDRSLTDKLDRVVGSVAWRRSSVSVSVSSDLLLNLEV